MHDMTMRERLPLHELQNRFVESLTCNDCDVILLEHFTPKRWQCYQNNYHFGLIKALKHTYPVCLALVGEKFFQALAYHYVKKNVPGSFSLNDYGSDFSEFISSFKPAESLIYLSCVAALEWSIHQVLLGPDHTSLARNALSVSGVSEINPAELKVDLNQNCILFSSPYPVDRIWETNQIDYEGETLVDLQEGAVNLIIFRQHFDLRIDRVTALEWQLLHKMQEGVSLEQLKNNREGWSADNILNCLLRFVERGYIKGIE